jgi:hypothetical protein
VRLSAPELEKLLMAKHFDEENASALADRYQFGRKLLKERPTFNYIGPNRNR